MSNKTEPTTPLEFAADAVNYTLQRIASDPNLRYHAGACTEVFERLKTAQAALTGNNPQDIEDQVLNAPLRRKANGQLLDEIRELVEGYCDGAADANEKADLANKVMEIIRS